MASTEGRNHLLALVSRKVPDSANMVRSWTAMIRVLNSSPERGNLRALASTKVLGSVKSISC